MDIEYVKTLSYKSVRDLYKSHLESLELGQSTVGTVTGDTFYLWNNTGKDAFWNAVTSTDFDETAKAALLEALAKNSSGNIPKLINGYVSNLRRFRDFIYETELESGQDNTEALKEFLLDIECLDPLSEWTSRFNLFDILKISRVEIRHSNMLSWLLSPNENHGLGESVLRGFIQFVVSSFENNSEIFDTLLMDCHDFVIQREWHNIDILASSASERFVLCIENKIDSGEHDDQLNRYRRLVEESFPGYKKMYIYLSPDGYEASDSGTWCSMGYNDVLSIIENARHKTKLLPDAELLIENYVDTIRRDIVGDERLAQICAEIYAKHKKALDLIFENRPDRTSEIADIFKRWAIIMAEKGDVIFPLEKGGKTNIRFKTAKMSELLPDSPNTISGWGTSNYYCYEIHNNNGKEFFVQFVLNSRDIPDDLRRVCDRINEHFPSRMQKENWQWRTPFTTRHSKIDEDYSEEKIFAQLDKKFDEIKSFEKKLFEALTSEQDESV